MTSNHSITTLRAIYEKRAQQEAAKAAHGLNLRDFRWIAGFLEGEGSFRMSTGTGSSPCVEACQVQKWPVAILHKTFGGYLVLRPRSKRDRGRPIWRWTLVGRHAAALMLTLYSLMSPRRQKQIYKALIIWRNRQPRNAAKTHCKRGHEFTVENTYIGKQRHERLCRQCKKGRIRYERRRSVA